MVLLTCSLHRLATRLSPCARSIFTASAPARPKPTWTTRSTTFRSQKLNTFGNIRMLTGDKREKVKVLLVLYDGKKHAEEVRYIHFPLYSFGLRLFSQPLQLNISNKNVLLIKPQSGPRASRHDRERTRHPQMARGSRT